MTCDTYNETTIAQKQLLTGVQNVKSAPSLLPSFLKVSSKIHIIFCGAPAHFNVVGGKVNKYVAGLFLILLNVSHVLVQYFGW